MAVSLRGYRQGVFTATGTVSVAHPSGTAVGDLGVVFCETGSDKKPKVSLPSGWVCFGTTSDGVSGWSKVLTATDIASPLSIVCRTVKYQVFQGASAVGRVGRGESLSVGYAGGALVLCGWAFTTDTLTTSAKIHATDVVNGSYVSKGTSRVSNVWWAAMASSGVGYIDTNAKTFLAVELVPQLVPYPPTLLSPDDGVFLDYSDRVTMSGRHNSVNGGAMLGLSTRIRKVGTTAWSYVALQSGTDAFILTTAPTVIGNGWFSEITVRLPISLLGNNTTFEWQMADTEQVGSSGLSAYSASKTFSLRSKPTVAASVSGSGLTRTVSWTRTLTNGVQTWWRVRICPAASTTPANPIYDSGVVSGSATSTAIPAMTAWTNGGSYKAWVTLGQTGGQQTADTASTSFTVSWTLPAGPTSVTVQAGPPLRVTASGLVVGRRVRLSFTANGVAYTAVRTAAVASVSFDVPLAPYRTPVTYSIEQEQVVSGVGLWSTPVTVVGVGTDRGTYLVAADLSEWLRVHIDSDSDRADTEGLQVSYGLGAEKSTVLRTPSQGLTGRTTLAVQTQADKQALLDWLARYPSFILRWHPERDGSSYVDIPALTIARVTPRSEDRYVQRDIQARKVDLAWVEQ